MKILITGGTGLLGKALVETADSSYEMIATYLGNYKMDDSGQVKYLKLDIQDSHAYGGLFMDFKPEVVIHTASIGSPDYAETHKKETWQVNVGGTQNIISNCERVGAKLIYISSNAIYDGERAPYSETDLAKPINYYGQIKLKEEKLIKKTKVSYAIIRPILMYGWNHAFERPNITTIALGKLRRGESVNVYDDVLCNPLLSECCAEAVWQVIKGGAYDIFNIAGKDIVSIYGLVKAAAEAFGFSSHFVKPVQQGFFKELIRRPKNTSYETSKMENVLGLRPLTLKEGLEIMKSKSGKEYARA